MRQSLVQHGRRPHGRRSEAAAARTEWLAGGKDPLASRTIGVIASTKQAHVYYSRGCVFSLCMLSAKIKKQTI